MKITLIIALLLFHSHLWSQSVNETIYRHMDSQSKWQLFSQTDFSKPDSIQLWTYQLTMNDSTEARRLKKPLAVITFRRNKATNQQQLRPYLKGNKIKYVERKFIQHSSPNIEYEVYDIADTVSLFKNYQLWEISSCLMPNVGGDFFIIGNYFFYNRHVCVSCAGDDPNKDICRPFINLIFCKINENISCIQSIVSQLPIKAESIKRQEP